MRGKKSDPIFISKFIQESVSVGCETSDAIVKRAKNEIEVIDAKIQEIDHLKKLRSKLLDVVSLFGKEAPAKDRTDEIKLLSFFKLEYPETCKSICEGIKKISMFPADSRMFSGVCGPEYNFSVKQMLECKILMRTGDYIDKGERFDEYMKFITRAA